MCFKSKQTLDVFSISDNKTSEIFELLHCDLWGPHRVPAHCGSRYFLTIVNDFSRSVWLYLVVDKTEVKTHLRNFFLMVDDSLERK